MTVILVEQIELSLNTCFYSLFENLVSLNAYTDFLAFSFTLSVLSLVALTGLIPIWYTM